MRLSPQSSFRNVLSIVPANELGREEPSTDPSVDPWETATWFSAERAIKRARHR
jgi:hypothetical protein